MKKISKLTIISVIVMIIGIVQTIRNDYTTEKPTKCVILDKLAVSGGYKSAGYFCLVLKDERGIVFDIHVRPSTYSIANVGSSVTFNLSDRTIVNDEYWNNISVLWFLMILLGAIVGLLSFLLLDIWGYD